MSTTKSQTSIDKSSKKKNLDLDRIRNISSNALDEEYRRRAHEVWDLSWDMLVDTQGWTNEGHKTDDLDSGIICSKHFPKLGKVFRLEGFIDASPELVFEETVIKVDKSPTWNPSLIDCKTLRVVDDNIDVSYQATSSAAGGLVSSRDFVTLRHWKSRDGVTLSAGCAVLHPDMPPCKGHVRGENRAGGWVYKPVEGNPNKCVFGWIVCTDLKGWLPQYVVDRAFSGMLIDFLNDLRRHIEKVKTSNFTSLG